MISLRTNSALGRIGDGAPSDAATTYPRQPTLLTREENLQSQVVGSCASSISTSAAILYQSPSQLAAWTTRISEDIPDLLVSDSPLLRGVYRYFLPEGRLCPDSSCPSRISHARGHRVGGGSRRGDGRARLARRSWGVMKGKGEEYPRRAVHHIRRLTSLDGGICDWKEYFGGREIEVSLTIPDEGRSENVGEVSAAPRLCLISPRSNKRRLSSSFHPLISPTSDIQRRLWRSRIGDILL